MHSKYPRIFGGGGKALHQDATPGGIADSLVDDCQQQGMIFLETESPGDPDWEGRELMEKVASLFLPCPSLSHHLTSSA